MKEFSYTISQVENLHARPAGLLVKKAKNYASRIILSVNGKTCDASRLMAVMALCAKRGATISISIEGPDEEVCAKEMETFFRENL